MIDRVACNAAVAVVHAANIPAVASVHGDIVAIMFMYPLLLLLPDVIAAVGVPCVLAVVKVSAATGLPCCCC